MKPSKSNGAHLRLTRLYRERIPMVAVTKDGKQLRRPMNQEEFGAAYGIGTQGMVSQYLNGIRPLNIEAAAKFARGLRCTIHDISPEMAKALRSDILPVLGRAALVVLFVAGGSLSPPPAFAGVFAEKFECMCIMLNRLRARIFRLASRLQYNF